MLYLFIYFDAKLVALYHKRCMQLCCNKAKLVALFTSASNSFPKSTAKSETCVRNGSFELPMFMHFTLYMYNVVNSDSQKKSVRDRIHSP